MTKNICSQCGEERQLVYFEHPVTHETMYICNKCRIDLSNKKTYYKQRRQLANIGCFMPLFVLASIAILIFGNKSLGLAGIIICSTIWIFSAAFLEYFIKRSEKNFGLNSKSLHWCKTCIHFRKIRNWENKKWQSKEIPSSSDIPCKISNKTNRVWSDYFNLGWENRAIYPKECSSWEKK